MISRSVVVIDWCEYVRLLVRAREREEGSVRRKVGEEGGRGTDRVVVGVDWSFGTFYLCHQNLSLARKGEAAETEWSVRIC